MSYSTKAHLFFGADVSLPEGVEWDTIDRDTEYGIRVIRYGSDGDSMYAVAIAESVKTSHLDSMALVVSAESNIDWPRRILAFCKKRDARGDAPSWLLAVERF